MKYINFIISRINYLPYYIPLVIEAYNRKIKSNFFLSQSNKPFVSPYTPSHLAEIKKIASQYDVMIFDVFRLVDFPGITFFCEGDIVGKENKDKPSPNFQYMTPKHTKVSIVCNYEYVMFYHKYIQYVDHVIFLHKFWAYHFNLISPKNLYLGSPKYDMSYFNTFDTTEERNKYLYDKYKLNVDEKYILIVYPKDPKKHHKKHTAYPTPQFMLSLYQGIRQMGYKVIVKTRKQDPVKEPELKGDYYFEDIDYYPCNSMELIELSRMVIYFSSSINEECVALETPYIDFKVDQKKDRFDLLNHTPYGNVWAMDMFKYGGETVETRIKKFIVYYEKMHYQPDKIDSHRVFTTYYTKMVWEGGNSASKRIIDWVEKKHEITI